MLKCSYVVLIFNNQDNIPQLVDSLQKINGNFRREFIFIDNGSSDNSLSILKQSILLLPKTTIILRQNFGIDYGIEKILGFLTGDYIHFVKGSEILKPDSTMKLINLCTTMDAEVVVGLSSNASCKEEKVTSKIIVKHFPIKEVLENTISIVRNIGSAGSLVKASLLNKISQTEGFSYLYGIYLPLACAKHSKFIFTNEVISITNKNILKREQLILEQYNNLQIILNFIRQNLQLCEAYKTSLILALALELFEPSKKLKYYLKYSISKIFNNHSLNDIIGCYEKELAKLL